jgi:putative serine protease PepD
VGRGLLATAATVGGLLSVALLWAMLPSAGGPAPLAVQSTRLDIVPASRSIAPAPSNTRATISAPATSVRSSSIDSTVLASTTTQTPQVTQVPAQTSVIVVTTVVTSPQGVPAAVALSGADYAITTASAATAQTTMSVALLDGPTVTVEVILVDQATGLAVVDLPDGVSVEPRAMSSGRDGESVSILGATPADAVLTMSSGAMVIELDAAVTVAEAAPVINGAGQLVGLCTWNAGSASVVPLDAAESLRLAAEKTQPEPWLGIKLGGDPMSPLTVAEALADGPAASAGLQAGDTITAIDGTAVTIAAQLKDAVAALDPGATVLIEVRRSDGTMAPALTVTDAADAAWRGAPTATLSLPLQRSPPQARQVRSPGDASG